MAVNPIVVTRTWMAKDGSQGMRLYLWCPACDDVHGIEVDPKAPGPSWQWDGNLEAPTISPSIKVFNQNNCHSHVKNGAWEFLGDCGHALAGKTVAMVPLPDWLCKDA